MKPTQQWKFKPQTIPTNTTAQALGDAMSSPSSPIPSSAHRGGSSRKRRHSEPHIQDTQNAYKHYVTHWKLPTCPPTNCINTNTNTSIYTTYNAESTLQNTIHPNTTSTTSSTSTRTHSTNLTIDVSDKAPEDWKGTTQKQVLHQSPHVYRPSPISPISPTLSPHAIPPSPSPPSDTSIRQHWNHEPIKSMFHPYKRDPLSPTSENKLDAIKDRRRNSAPHISFKHHVTNSAPYLDNRLETIPELSFPSHLHISPPHPSLVPLNSHPPPFPTSKNYASLQTHKRSHEHLQANPPDSTNSFSLFCSSVSSSPPTNVVDDIPKFARNTRRRMSVDNLLA